MIKILSKVKTLLLHSCWCIFCLFWLSARTSLCEFAKEKRKRNRKGTHNPNPKQPGPFPFLPHRPKPRQPSSHPVFPWPSSVLRPSKFRPRPTAHGPFSLAPARGWPSATRSSRLRPRLSPLSACASPLSPHCSPGPPVGSISHLRLPRARATTGISGRNHRGFPSLLPRRDPRRSPLNHHETPPDPHPSHSAA